MKPYIGLVHQDPGSAYGITFPEAPGCVSAAGSAEDVFGMAEEAPGLWLDGMADDQARVPVVRDPSDIQSDPDWAESFASAAFVIAVRVRTSAPSLAA